MNGYRNRFRTLAKDGTLKTFAEQADAEAHAQRTADRTRAWCGVEMWDESHPQDDLNKGWALIGTKEPTGTLREHPGAGSPAPAPLAQLRSVDENAWKALYGADRHENPGTDTVTQALAAALLGNNDLALIILRDGYRSLYLSTWPEMRPAKVG